MRRYLLITPLCPKYAFLSFLWFTNLAIKMSNYSYEIKALIWAYMITIRGNDWLINLLMLEMITKTTAAPTKIISYRKFMQFKIIKKN